MLAEYKEVKISVIVPVYNVEDYLKECLDSLAAQTFYDIEVIMVDDGSTDSSGDIASAYAGQDSRFIYIRKENAGVSAARNTGLEHVTGDFITLVDADDVIPEDAFEKMHDAAVENEADIVVGKVMRLKESAAGTARASDIIYSQYEKNTSIRKNRMLLYDSITCCKLFRKSYWDSVGARYPEDLGYCEDLPVAMQLYGMTDKVVMLDEVTYLWRIREGENLSSTQQKNLRMVEQRVKAIGMASDFIRDRLHDSDLLSSFKLKELYMDLNIVINKSVELDEETLQQAMGIIRGYMKKEGLSKELKRLPLIYEKKYKAVLKGDYKKLEELRAFQEDKESCISAERKGDKVTGIFPSSIVLFKKADLKTTLDCELLRQNILRIDVDESSISILGCAFLRYLPVSKASDADIRIWLVDGDRNKVKELSVKRRNTKTPGKMESKKNSNNIDYTGTGYTAVLTAGEADALAPGSYRFLVEWESCGQHREALIQRIKPEDEEKIKGLPFPGASRAVLDTTINREPVVIIHEDNQEDKELS